MAAQPFWVTDDQSDLAWDFCWLGEDLLPGIASLSVETAREIDVQRQKGSNGANLSDDGYEPATVSITLQIYTADQWATWQKVRPKIDPRNAGGLKRPLQIVHPETADAGVENVYVRRISTSNPSARSGKTISIDCIEWFPAPKPAKKSTTPKAQRPQETKADVPAPDESLFFPVGL